MERTTVPFETLVGAKVISAEWCSGGTDQDSDDYLVVRLEGDLTLYASAPTLYGNA